MRESREPDHAAAALHRGHRCSCSLLAALLPTLLRRMPKVRCQFGCRSKSGLSTHLIFAELMPTGFRRPERAIAAIRPDLISISTVRRSNCTTPPPDPRRSLPTSVVLQRLLDEMPAGHFTLGWLMGSLRKRSFGIIMLLLAVVAMAPGVSIVAGLLLMIPAFQMMAAQPAPAFPRCIADRPLPTRDLAALVQRAVPVLRCLEKVIRSLLAHPARGDQAPCRHRCRDTEHDLAVHSDPPEQRRPRPADRPDLPGLSRGGRAPALSSPCWLPPS